MNRPKRDRRKRPRDRIWSGPLASWTDTQTRRQHERDACDAPDIIVSIYLAKYALLAPVLAYIDLSGPTPINPELLRTLASVFFWLTLNTVLFLALWWFWPRLVWPRRRRSRPRFSPYPSPPSRWLGRIVWGMPVLLGVTLLVLFSGRVALIASLGFVGMWLVLTGIRRRVGCDERCRCGYPVATPRWSRGRCPECGRDLDRPRAIILGHDTRSPARLTAGLTLLAVSVALTILSLP